MRRSSWNTCCNGGPSRYRARRWSRPWWLTQSAAAPATCGVAYEVPDPARTTGVRPSREKSATDTPWPGAATSIRGDAVVCRQGRSVLVVAATAMQSPYAAG
ncbi:hypothetical protein REH70_05990 [Cellulomonas sp. ATA003]|nr:hypothetical protein [Cellulomonas sp. ATA003]WNB86763.1 hypothetical protein REH70_05990 [Cellulomonas sp. ATA003]